MDGQFTQDPAVLAKKGARERARSVSESATSWTSNEKLSNLLKKCDVCLKSCGSVLKFQGKRQNRQLFTNFDLDSRCLSCRKKVHTECRDKINPIYDQNL